VHGSLNPRESREAIIENSYSVNFFSHIYQCIIGNFPREQWLTGCSATVDKVADESSDTTYPPALNQHHLFFSYLSFKEGIHERKDIS
jgi:hypothetical protein